MQRAVVLGSMVSSAKHATMAGRRLLIAQPLGVADAPDGDPMVVVDELGAAPGDVVLVTSDGKHAQQTLGKTTPVRFTVMGLVDRQGQ